ncbi:MAG: efflux RND transporter permease subunit [Cyanobacteria bacterium]|nr:efflux RND transporter permease subunit [Cyanobacteria bacterium CG_2015-16_32_12]NCO78923.1 efflux RND transporter permease subunit [Cyanobacteria bacterium CG_2015-22_32_23]NCQ40787.1 efflux RND transporter permease subunit [Cyanobacteria bacterium CG_2015-04_32_10]NCS83796.1 efflux RND transporter permease subunit [Cyanobacteria bacterium CG_2015-02_32_10]
MNFSLRQRLNISRLAIQHPWLTINFWIAVSVAGLLAFSSLQYALFPDVTFPVVIIRASGNFDTAIETETKLTNPLQKPLLNLKSIENIVSSTFKSETVITSLFFAGDTLDSATKIIEKAIANVDLPENTKIEIIPYNLNESSAISYVLTSEKKSLADIAEIANNKIIPALKNIDGILKVNILGLDFPEDEKITPSFVSFNGKESLGISIIKRGDGNTLEVVKSVESVMKKLASSLSEITINVAQTEANYIKEATQATIDTLVLAIILAVLVIFPFLGNFTATFITALAIPISLLGTFIVMAIGNFNLETITLLALALVIGIVVDDAIVDVENIMRHLENGDSPKEAAIKGSDEIGLTVSASTLTIVAVFLPVALTSGNVGQFFKPFGLTVSAAVIISLLVARTLSPVLAIFWLKRKNHQQNLENSLMMNISHKIVKQYSNLLIWSLSHRKIVLIGALISFIIGIALIPFIPQGFIPQLDRGEFNIIYTTELPKIPSDWNINQNQQEKNSSINQDNSSFNWLGEIKENPNGFILRRTRRIGEKIEEVILDIPEIESIFNIVGFRGQPNLGKIYIKLKSEGKINAFEVQNKIRKTLPVIKGVNISVEDIKFVDTGDDKPFSFRLLGDNLTSLNQRGNKIKGKLANFSALTDLTMSPSEIATEENNDINIIEHFNGKRAITFSANLGKDEALGDLTTEVKKEIQSLLSSDVTLSLGGDSARMEEIARQFGIIFVLSITFMLLLLWALFGSLLEPMVVALSLPLSIVGAMLGLLFTQSAFGMISLLGIIFLLGLLDKNALLLVDYANQLRKKGMSRQDAIITTGITRLRPILMTTSSTILGMLPIAMGWGVGAQLRQPMAVAIIGGLLTSTILCLIFVPVFYTIVEDLWLKIQGKYKNN